MAWMAAAAPLLQAAAAAGGAYMTYKSGVDKKTAANREAFQEKMRAEEEGMSRREQLLGALAAQNAAFGAGGVTGGVLQTGLTDIREFGKEEKRRTSMSNIRQSEMKRVGSAQATSGLIGAGTQVVKGAATYAKNK